MFSEVVVKVCADSWLDNKKATVMHFEMGNFVKLVKFCQKSIFSPQGCFSSFCQFFVKNEIFWSSLMVAFGGVYIIGVVLKLSCS